MDIAAPDPLVVDHVVPLPVAGAAIRGLMAYMASVRSRFAPLHPWQVGTPRYVVLWLGAALAATVSIWLLVAALGQQDLPIITRIVVVLFAGFGALLCLGALDTLLTGGAKVITGTVTDSGIDLARAGETWHIPWSRLAAAGISARRTRFGDRGAALDLWFKGKVDPGLESIGTWVSEIGPKQRPRDRRLRIASMALPTLNQLSERAPAILEERWFDRFPRG